MVKSALSNSFIPDTFWKVGIYIRLSREDYTSAQQGMDSVSVQHQRVILRKYAKENGMFIVDEFVDDGYSGTNFDRPGFRRMIDAINRKEVNCVITKDLSRLGRNHLEVGYYIETFFPENRVRYIAINENYDSLQGDSDIVPFMNIINEMAAKQTSKKNRQVFESKFNDGGMHSLIVSYGYMKDPANKDHRVIDKEVVDIVHKVYDLADAGNGPIKIQKWLFDHRIECPSYRVYLKTGMYANLYEGCSDERKYKWNISMIRRMLSDKTYLGHSVHYKKRKISYKHKKQIPYPEEQWMIVENTHEPIIDKDQFDRVQEVIISRKRSSKTGEVGLFAGLLKCSGCNMAMAKYKRGGATMNRSYYVCSRHTKDDILDTCTSHYTREDELSAAVLARIQKLFSEVKLDKNALVKKITRINEKSSEKSSVSISEEIVTTENRMKVLGKLMGKLYEDWASEVISEDNFHLLTKKYQEEQATCRDRLIELRRHTDEHKNEEDRAKKFVDLVDRLAYPEVLTRELLFALISKIVVHEPTKSMRGKRNTSQQIDIYWKHIGLG